MNEKRADVVDAALGLTAVAFVAVATGATGVLIAEHFEGRPADPPAVEANPPKAPAISQAEQLLDLLVMRDYREAVASAGERGIVVVLDGKPDAQQLLDTIAETHPATGPLFVLLDPTDRPAPAKPTYGELWPTVPTPGAVYYPRVAGELGKERPVSGVILDYDDLTASLLDAIKSKPKGKP